MRTGAPTVHPWPQDEPLDAAAMEASLKSEGLAYYRWSNGLGDVYPTHEHAYH